MLVNTRDTYGTVTQLFHWVTALLILVLLPLGLFMHDLPIGSTEEVAYKSWFYSLHKTLGVTVFLIAIGRVFWALTQSRPSPLYPERKLESLTAQTVHWMLYACIILMPLTGWLHHSATEGFAPIWGPYPQDLPWTPKSADFADFFGTAHFLTGVLLGTSLLLHLAGAAKHLIFEQDDTLNRMIPGQYTPQPAKSEQAQHNGLSIILAGAAIILLGVATIGVYAFNKSGVQQNIAQIENSPIPQHSWLVDGSKSELTLEVTQSGTPVAGQFKTWTATINFDPDNLSTWHLKVDVDIASLKIGSVSESAVSPDFLNAETYPNASFVSEELIKTDVEAYEARGMLTLAGRSNPINLPFYLKIDKERAYVTGQVVIKRLDFGVGEKGFSTDGMVGFDVKVGIDLEAIRETSQ